MNLASLELLLEAVPDAMLIVDEAGIIVAANTQTERLFGWTRAELERQPIDLLVPERYHAQHGPHRASYFAEPRPRPMGAGLDLLARRKDGSEFPCEVSLAPTHVDDTGLVTVAVRDIAERKRVEEKYRRFLDAAPDALVIVGPDGRIVHVNSRTEQLFGHARENLLGRPVEVLMAERFRGRHERHRDGYFHEPVVRAMGSGLELFGLRADGHEFPVEISLSPVETAEGVLVASAIRDISQRKAVEAVLHRAHEDLGAKTAQLEAANRELEAFSYSVAHDLRAPLRGMMGFTQILLSDHAAELSPDARDCLDEINASSRKMGALIDALLTLSRVTRGSLEPERVDLGALAREVAAELRATEPERKVEVVIGPHLETILDPRLARGLIENLVGNAWKFTRLVPDARIEIGSTDRLDAGSEADGEVAFFVADNGAGFDMAYVDKLFAPFQRLHAARDYPGTGIGLATVQRILSRHGGRIWARSGVGQGATFWFSTPQRKEVAS
jgi:PAS domain S-box-containing protein